MIKAIIFDCFGVLLTDALQVICDELRARNPAAADQIRDLVRLSNRGVIDPEISSRQVADILGTTYDAYRQQIQEGEVKNTRLLAYVGDLHQAYKTALLSNIGKGSLLRRFSEGELAQLFDAVVASGEVGYAKPESEIYEITAERLGVRLEECVFTDDREEYCEGARGVGMQAIYFQDFEQFKRDLEALLPSKPSA
jgi:HAD superfamily hydrolase (TIGR01509 family)